MTNKIHILRKIVVFYQGNLLDYAEQQKQTSKEETIKIDIICFIEDDKTVLRQQLDKMKNTIIGVFF
jgi:hypothetical protein